MSAANHSQQGRRWLHFDSWIWWFRIQNNDWRFHFWRFSQSTAKVSLQNGYEYFWEYTLCWILENRWFRGPQLFQMAIFVFLKFRNLWATTCQFLHQHQKMHLLQILKFSATHRPTMVHLTRWWILQKCKFFLLSFVIHTLAHIIESSYIWEKICTQNVITIEIRNRKFRHI